MPQSGSQPQRSQQPSIESVRQRNESSLLAIDGVVGVGIGQTQTGDPAITVYLRDVGVKRRVPAEVEGYPVETVTSGDIDAYERR